MRRFLERKDVLTLALAIAAGLTVFYQVPFPETHPLMQLVQLQKPQLFLAVKAAYVAMLFTTPYTEEAAKSVGVSTRTLLRWQKLPVFEKAFREARRATFRQCIARLQQASGPAVTTLLKIIVDPSASLAVKARCAYYILEQARKAVETEDLDARVAQLERSHAANGPPALEKPGI